MYINNIDITISNNNKWLDKLVDSFNTPFFTETFVKVYDRFRYHGATFLQWRALKTVFNEIFTKEEEEIWKGILTLMQKTCITFPQSDGGSTSYCWNRKIIHKKYGCEGWMIKN